MYRHFLSQMAVVQEGREPLPHYNLCGIYMPVGRLVKHQMTQWCVQNTQMLW